MVPCAFCADRHRKDHDQCAQSGEKSDQFLNSLELILNGINADTADGNSNHNRPLGAITPRVLVGTGAKIDSAKVAP
jgi:hypothetical protein